MAFQIIWFILWAVLWAVYFMLDGFDLGVGILQKFLGRNEAEGGNHTHHRTRLGRQRGLASDRRRCYLCCFPYDICTYVQLSLHRAAAHTLLIDSAGRVCRVEREGRGCNLAQQMGNRFFCLEFPASTALRSCLRKYISGLAYGCGWIPRNLFTLLNPYGLLTGVFFVLLFIMHGALWIGFKTTGDLSKEHPAWQQAMVSPSCRGGAVSDSH